MIQEPVLFSTSIAENILYGVDRPDSYDVQALADVAEKANAWTFISSFPDGLKTTVGERGQTLSGQLYQVYCKSLDFQSLVSRWSTTKDSHCSSLAQGESGSCLVTTS